MSELFLGVDLGTTSVKVVLLDPRNDSIIFEISQETKATIQLPDSRMNEQAPKTIFETVQTLLGQLPGHEIGRVGFIGVSGQMHGVVLWKEDAWTWREDGAVMLNEAAMSNLVTWQDSRCTPEFLASLPVPDSHLKVNTGFGIPTIFWLQRNDPRQLDGFTSAGTIHDFLVSVLTNNVQKPLMSPQNAGSWSYFDTTNETWNTKELKKGQFPVDLLPEIRPAGSLAGTLHSGWAGIPRGCKIGVALGDCQAQIYSSLFNKSEEGAAIINISTSLQIAFVMPAGFEPSKVKDVESKNKSIEYIPYFNNKYLATAAALTGGNCLAAFVKLLKNFVLDLGLEVDDKKIWEKILNSGMNLESTDLEIIPTLFGERSDPNSRASVANIHPGNLQLNHIARALCRGIISNAKLLMPQEFLLENGVSTIYGIGSALLRNPIFQQELGNIFDEVHICICQSGGDAALGAAAYGKITLMGK